MVRVMAAGCPEFTVMLVGEADRVNDGGGRLMV
jgi:hypothetical protein